MMSQHDVNIELTENVILEKMDTSHYVTKTDPREVINVITSRGRVVCLDNERTSQGESSEDELSREEETEVAEQRKINHVRFVEPDEPECYDKVMTPYKTLGGKGDGYGQLQDAVDVICLSQGKIVISDLVNNKLQVFSKTGRPNAMYVSDEMVQPWGLTLTSENNFAVVSTKTKTVSVIDLAGEVLSTFSNTRFQRPCGIATTNTGHFVICDSVANTVTLHDVDGDILEQFKNERLPFKQPRYVAVSQSGEVIVCDSGNHCVKVFDGSGKFLRQMGEYGKGKGCFKFPRGVCTDSSGKIFVADHYNNRISVFSQAGEFLYNIVTSGNGLQHPQGVAVSSSDNLYVTCGDLKASHILVFRLRP